MLAKKAFPDIKIYHLAHNNLNNFYEKLVHRVPENSSILLIDICCDKAFLNVSAEKLKKKNINIEIYDHHETNDWLASFKFSDSVKSKIIFDLEKSASLIFFEAMLPDHPELEKYREFVIAINDRDLWLNQTKEGVLLAKLHQSLGDAEFVARFFTNPSVVFDEKENFLLNVEKRKEDKKNEILLNRINLKEDENKLPYGVIFGDANSSDLLNLAIIKYNLAYAILINLNSKKGSIRSNGQFDCAKYAENFNGGGHKNAAGFRIDFDFPEF